jgi:hypothetical protein
MIVFRIRNLGRETLNIEKVETVCDCMIFELSDSIIDSKDSGFIKIKNSPELNDGVARPIIIYSNSNNNPHVIWLMSR